jgi:hypothetical protein
VVQGAQSTIQARKLPGRIFSIPRIATDRLLHFSRCDRSRKIASTPEEWRERFDKDLLDPKKKTSRPETQRVKILIFYSLAMCHMTESMAALQLDGGRSQSARAEYESARNCASEGISALKKQLPKARQELGRSPRAVEKLNSYAAMYLSAMSAIPRVAPSNRSLEQLQAADKRKIRDKEAELDVELL